MQTQQDFGFTHEVDQPAVQHFLTDQRIARRGIFMAAFLCIGVFYLAIVKLPVSQLVPVQQLQQLTDTLAGGSSSIETTSNSAAQSSRGPAATSSGATASPETTAVTVAATAAPSSSGPVLPLTVPTDQPSPQPSATPRPASTPVPPASQAAGKSYVVQSGDTLTSIARHFNVSVQALAAMNKIPDSGLVKVGERVDVP